MLNIAGEENFSLIPEVKVKKAQKRFTNMPIFVDEEIEKYQEKQMRFLRLIFPFLDENEWHEGCIELRPRSRSAGTDFLRSFNLWRFNQKDIEHHRRFLKRMMGQPFCLFFASYAFDYKMETKKADGKPYQKGKVNNQNALETYILPADFDGMDLEEFSEEIKKLNDLGIETLNVFTGHGYQAHVLLDKACLDKSIHKKWTELLLSKGFNVDPALVDPARVLRVPSSFNCKAYDSKQTKYFSLLDPKPIETDVVNWTERRYSLVDVFQKVQGLLTIIPQNEQTTEIELKAIPTKEIPKTEARRVRKLKESEGVCIKTLKESYKMLDVTALQPAIQKMLMGTQSGIRNATMLFLIPFLRNSMGLSLTNIKQIMTVWANLSGMSESHVKSEVERIHAMGFSGKYGKYSSELAKVYGYFEFKTYTRENKIVVANKIFDELNEISDGSFRIYLAILLTKESTGVKEGFTAEEIQKVAGISQRTFERNIKDLTKNKYVCKKLGNRRKGEANTYYPNPFFSSAAGFTMLGSYLVKGMLKELTDGEIKLYCYIAHQIGQGGQRPCRTSQEYLAKKIGKAGSNAISMMTDSLVQKGFMQKETFIRDNVYHCNYNLNG